MKLEKAYLLVTISYETRIGEYGNKWPERGFECENGTIYHNDINGIAMGFSSKAILEPKISNKFWKTNIEQILLYDEYYTNQKTYLSICYLLNPNAIKVLVSPTDGPNNKGELSRLFSTLLLETLPDLEEMSKEWDQLKSSLNLPELFKTKPKYKLLIKDKNTDFLYFRMNNIELLDFFLIVIPSKTEIKNLNKKLESPSNFLLRFENMTNRNLKDKVLIPYSTVDYIETISQRLIWLQNVKLRIFICTMPNGKRNDITLPWAISNAYELALKNHLLKEIRVRLTEVYANRIDIRGYINSISKKNIFKNYINKFNNEKLEYLQAKFEIEESINSYKKNIIKTYPYKYKDNYDAILMKDICKGYDRFSWSDIQKSNNEFDNLIENIEQTLSSIGNKDSFITNYLRDILSVESMRANLKLQKSIKWLTYIAVSIALFSIFLSLYSTEIKTFINRILQLF